MFNQIKKLFKTLGSRLIYLFVGLSFALVIIVAQAAISSGTVSGGTRLTSARWNTMIGDLQSLDTRLGGLDTRVGAIDTRVTTLEGSGAAGVNACRDINTSTWAYTGCDAGEYIHGISLGNAERPVWTIRCCSLY